MNPIRDHVSCEDFVESVTAYWEDRLTGPARDRFEEHYLVCPPCRSYAGQLRLTTSLLARLEDDGARPGPEPADSAPPEPDDQIRAGPHVPAFTFLDAGAVAPFAGVPWPRPDGSVAGGWVEGGADPWRGTGGVSACRPADLPYWVNDELWRVELDGVVHTGARKVVARRGRLVARVAGWDAAARTAFVDSCLDALRRALVDLADRRHPEDLAGLLVLPVEQVVPAIDRLGPATQLTAAEREVRGYLEDAVAYRELLPTVAFVCAVGCETASPGGGNAERRRQASWFAEHLDLG